MAYLRSHISSLHQRVSRSSRDHTQSKLTIVKLPLRVL